MFAKLHHTKGWLAAKPKFIIGIASAVVLITATAAITLAAAPDAANIVHACYRNTTGMGSPIGSVRVIANPPYTCNGNETAITWNGTTPGLFVTNLAGAQLDHADLRYRNFQNTNLSSGYFHNTRFDYADVTGANLSGSYLGYARLAHQDLSTTNISNTDLTQTYFAFVNFGATSLGGTTINATTFENVTGLNGRDFRPLSPQSLRTVDTNLSNTNFSDLPIDGFTLNTSDLTNADFSGTTISSGIFYITDSTVTGMRFNNADFTISSTLGSPQLANITGTGTDFTGANMINSAFSNANLTSPNFTSANLTGVSGLDNSTLTSPVWSNTTCPDGTNSNSNGGTCAGHLVP